MELIACGKWLEFSMPKRILLTAIYWLPWVLRACWRSKYIWFRYALWKLFGKKPITWGDLLVDPPLEEFKYIVRPSMLFRLALSGRGHWLWYEDRKQLEANRDTDTHPVDWDGKGKGWYPFW